MERSAWIRIVVYFAMLIVTAAAFVAGGVITWQDRNYWEKQLRQVQVDSVQFAQEYRAGFREVNLAWLRYQIDRDPAERTRFQEAADRLSRQIARFHRESFVPESKEILGKLSEEFGHYRKCAEAFFDPASSFGAPDLLSQVNAASERVLALDLRLSAIQRGELASFVTRLRGEMDRLFCAVYLSMVLMLVAGGSLAWVAYRDLIAPLRRTVVRSRSLLEQNEKLAALGLLTAGLAHEIRNPLNSIKARLFTQRRVLGDGSAGLEDNRFIDEEVDRLEGIVVGALQFARPAPPAFERLQLPDALQPWCGLLQSSLHQAAIELKAELRSVSPVTADLNQLKQAILNLVNNAAESIGRNGTITLRTLPAQLHSGRQKRLGVAVEVQDSGQGISPEMRKRLFDPFYTTKQNGTGLGLCIAARIAHAHGGAIEFESAPGRGAVFRIVLPAA